MRSSPFALALTTSVLLMGAATLASAQSSDKQGTAPTSQQPSAQPTTPATTPPETPPSGSNPQTAAPATTQAPASAPTEKATTTTEAATPATDAAQAAAKAKMAAILERGARQPAKARTEADAKIAEVVNEMNASAVSEGNDKVAERFAGELAMTKDAMAAEKTSSGMSWGDLMITHLLLANAGPDLKVENVQQMKKDNGWSLIAAGMGYKLNDVVSALRAEAKVASGAAKADGKVAMLKAADEKTAATTPAKAEAKTAEAKTDPGAANADGAEKEKATTKP